MQLGLVNLVKFFDGFELDDHEIIDTEVDPKSAFDQHATLSDRKSKLPFNLITAVLQLEFQTGLVRRFEQSRPQVAMYGNCGTDNRFRNPVQLFFHKFSL